MTWWLRSRRKTAYPSAGDSPLSRNEHPRLILTADNLVATQARMADNGASGWGTEFDSWWTNQCLAAMTASPDTTVAALKTGMYLAFAYATYSLAANTYNGYSQAQIGTRAILYLTATSTSLALNSYDGNRFIPTFGTSWVWNAMNGTERQHMVDLLVYNNNTSPDVASGKFYNAKEPFNSQVNCMNQSRFLAALCLYGTGYADAWAGDVLTNWDGGGVDNGYFFRGVYSWNRCQTQIGLGTSTPQEGAFGQGFPYDWSYTLPGELACEEAYRLATLTTGSNDQSSRSAWYTASSDPNWFRKFGYRVIHLMRAYAKTNGGAPGGRDWWHQRSPYEPAQQQPLGAVAGQRSNNLWMTAIYDGWDVNHAGLCQWLTTNRHGMPGTTGATETWAWPHMFVLGKKVTALSPDDLTEPTSKETAGVIWCRSDWTDVDGPNYGMYAASYMADGAHDDSWWNGHVWLERKAPLLTARGMGLSSNNWPDSKNQIYFPDRNVDAEFDPLYDDQGGPRGLWTTPYPESAADLVPSTKYYFLGANGRRIRLKSGSRDCDYMMGDFTDTYDTATKQDYANPTRISYYERQVAWFPGAMNADPIVAVVFDRWTLANTRYWPTICWNPPRCDVTVSGYSSSYAGAPCNTPNFPLRNGTTFGHTTYVDATQATWDVSFDGRTGRCFLKFWAPSGRLVTLAGGPNENAVDLTNIVPKSMEMVDLYGDRNDIENGITAGTEFGLYFGKYHLQVVPSTVSATDYALTTIEGGNAGFSAATSELIVATTDFVGVRVGNRIAVFGKDGITKTAGTFTIPSAGTYNVNIAGLALSTSLTFTGGVNVTSIVGIDPAVASGNPITATSTSAGTVYLTIVVSGAGTVTISS